MSAMQPHFVYDDDVPDRVIASVHPASLDVVRKVLDANVHSPDGRSPWMWVRLPNGDLILGVYPQGDTYCDCEEDAQYPTNF